MGVIIEYTCYAAIVAFVVYFLGYLTFGKSYYKEGEALLFLDDLMKSRNEETLNQFILHFRSQGVPKSLILDTIQSVNGLLSFPEFIPSVNDSFRKDYKWTGFRNIRSEEYGTLIMSSAGHTLRKYVKSLREKDWENFETKNGPIDGYEALFEFMLMYFDTSKITMK